jgi:hypothetical protein
MALRVVVFGKEGDGAAFAALGTVRSILSSMHIEANIQIITDPVQITAAGVDRLPAVSIDNLIISQGYVPSRNEMARAMGQKVEQMEQARRSREGR